MKTFIPNQPIYIALSGPAGSGKTATANTIVPRSSIGAYGNIETSSKDVLKEVSTNAFPSTVWDHFFFAMPLYDMLEAKTTIGDEAQSRALYSLHKILNSIMMERIPYEDLVELVYDIYSLPIDTNGAKPRTFLQTAGDICRKLEENCFANYIKYKTFDTYRSIAAEYDRYDEDPPWYFSVVSDLRMPNEAKMIKDQANHMMFKFTASPEVLAKRIYVRDGITLTQEQASHHSENLFDKIPDEWFDLIIDTTDMTLLEQATTVYNHITQVTSQKD